MALNIDIEEMYVHCDWHYLYFEFDALRGIRVSRDGSIASAGTTKRDGQELISFLLDEDIDGPCDEGTWSYYAYALRLFLNLPVQDKKVVYLKEVVLVTDYATSLLPHVDRSLATIPLIQEDGARLFTTDDDDRHLEIAEYIEDQENPWYWSLQYIMSDGTVLNPLSAHLHLYGLCLPQALILPKKSKSRASHKSYWIFQGNEYASGNHYYRDVACALTSFDGPLFLTAQLDWQSQRQCLDVQKVKSFALSDYLWTLDDVQLAVRLPTGAAWSGLNMEWAFDPTNHVLAYHPGHQVASLIADNFREAFSSPNKVGSLTENLFATQRDYRESWRRRMEVPAAEDGSLLFQLREPRYTLAGALTNINASLRLAGNTRGILLDASRHLNSRNIRPKFSLSSATADTLSWTYEFAALDSDPVVGPLTRTIRELVHAFNVGIEAFAHGRSVAQSKTGVRRTHDLRLLRHRGIVRCLLAEVAAIYDDPQATRDQTLKSASTAIHNKIEGLFAAISGNCQSPLKELCSPKAMGHLKRVIELLLRPAFVPHTDIIEHQDGVICLDSHRIIMPFFATLIRILLQQHGENTFLKNSIKAIHLGVSHLTVPTNNNNGVSQVTDPKMQIVCTFAAPIPIEPLAALRDTVVQIDGSDLEEVMADDLVATFTIDDQRQRIDWFDLHPQVFFKGKLLTAEVAKRFATDGVVQYCGKYYVLDRSKVPSAKWLAYFWDRLRSTQPKPGHYAADQAIVQQQPSEILGLLALAAAGMPVTGGERWQKIARAFAKLSARPSTSEHEGDLNAKLGIPLKPFQQAGVRWLEDLYALGLGGILADDMGLGKTIQAIGFLRSLQLQGELGPTLIVMPPSLLHNWAAEIKKFTPTLSVNVIDSRCELAKLSPHQARDIVLTTYGLLHEHSRKFQTVAWRVAIFDEAQYLKNIRSKRTYAARELKAQMKICLSGTPLENHYGEFFSLVDLVVPGALGEYGGFVQTYVQVGGKAQPIRAEDVEYLRLKTLPLVMRRSKKAILSELPAKTETVHTLTFDKEQKKIYRDTAIAWNHKIGDLIASKGDKQAQLQMLTALLRLRQICSCPDMIANVEYTLVPPKFERLKEALGELAALGEPVIVFTSFRTTLEKLERELQQAGIFTLSISGKTPTRQRPKILAQFEAASGHIVLLMTQKVGGVGLNLTKASYVFHLEPWWNPQVESQATDRVYRIGQTRHVHIYRYIMEHSVEERIQQLKASKFKIFRDLLESDEGDPAKTSFTKNQLSQSDFEYLLKM